MTPHERLSCRVTSRLTVPSLHCGPSAPPTASQTFVPGGDWDAPVLYINTSWDQTERHHSKKYLPDLFHLTITYILKSLYLPLLLGHSKSETGLLPRRGSAFREGHKKSSTALCEEFLGGAGKAEESKLPGAGIPAKPCPMKQGGMERSTKELERTFWERESKTHKGGAEPRGGSW
jgi:hypothetical protein